MIVLNTIIAHKKTEIEARKSTITLKESLARAYDAPPTRGFVAALRNCCKMGHIALIAEIKRASPSKGLIRADFEPEALARAYEAGGASCLSVLTDERYFQGHDRYLGLARSATSCPVLRKDFIIDPWQISESRTLGADCVLLLMACLSDMEAEDMTGQAHDLGMDVLAEAHTFEEAERASRIGADLIGINNRNLKTMKVDIANGEAMLPKVRQHSKNALRVAESGLTSPQDLERMQKAGAEAFLIGESLMRQKDVKAATQNLLLKQSWIQQNETQEKARS